MLRQLVRGDRRKRRRRGGDAARPQVDGAWDAKALARLGVLAKLAASAAAWLDCGCVVVAAAAPGAAHAVLSRNFPDARVVDADLSVRDGPGGAAAAAVRELDGWLRVDAVGAG